MISCLSVSGCHPLPHSSFSLLLQCPPCLLLIIFLVPFPLLAPIFSRTELQGCRILCDIRLDFPGPAKQEIARDNISVCGRQRKASGTPLGEAPLNPSVPLGPHVAIVSAPLVLFFLALCPCLSHLFHIFFHSCGLGRDPFLVCLQIAEHFSLCWAQGSERHWSVLARSLFKACLPQARAVTPVRVPGLMVLVPH